MTDAASTGPQERVCPDCGAPAGDRPFCSSCGRNLATVERLPTRAEWQADQPPPPSDPGDEVRVDHTQQVNEDGAPASAAARETQSSSDIGRTVSAWVRGHRLIAGTGAVGIVAAIVAIIALSSGGGAVDPAAAQNAVALYVAGASNLNPGDATCSFTSTLSPGIFQYSCSTTIGGVEFQTMDATYDSHKDINTDPSAVTISNYQTVNVPPGYTYDPSTGHYAPPGQ